MIADHLTKRVWSWGNDRTTVQVWARWDGAFRVVQLERIEESSRYREVRGETFDSRVGAIEQAECWVDEVDDNGGDGEWAVFAEKVVKERDEAVRERDEALKQVESLKQQLEVAHAFHDVAVKERDASRAEIVWLHERLRKVVAEERADAVAWMRRAADKVVQRRLMRECGCKPDDEAAKAARQCADAIEKGKHVGAAGEKK